MNCATYDDMEEFNMWRGVGGIPEPMKPCHKKKKKKKKKKTGKRLSSLLVYSWSLFFCLFSTENAPHSAHLVT